MQSTDYPSKPPLPLLLSGLVAAGAIAFLAFHTDSVNAVQEVDWLSQLANHGDSGAQLQLGLAYRDGRYGLQRDPRTSLYWLSAAARGGDAYAADALANAYATGAGTPMDSQQALHWWEQAAKGGNADAQMHLGEYLLSQSEDATGLGWLRDAADRGDTRAHNDLTQLYHTGTLPDADLHRGENPVAALSARLDASGVNSLFTVWHTLASNSPAMQSPNALLARANSGDPVAEYQLALRYRDGAWAVEPNAQESAAWLQRSAAAGNHLAAQALAETRHSDTSTQAGVQTVAWNNPTNSTK